MVWFYVDAENGATLDLQLRAVKGEDTGFFSVSEEDLVQQDRLDRKVRRKHRHTGLKVFLVILFLLALVGGGGAFAYINGYGWPTQQSVAEQLFGAKTQGSDLAPYVASSLSTAQIQEISDVIPSGAEVSVTGVDRSMTQSTVYLTASLSSGGEQDYTVEMVRDGIGWKVESVTPVYLSQDADESDDTVAPDPSDESQDVDSASDAADDPASAGDATSAEPTGDDAGDAAASTE